MKNDNSLPFYGKLAIVIIIALALAEAMPEVINWLLVLILIGLVLGHYRQFAFLSQVLGSIGK